MSSIKEIRAHAAQIFDEPSDQIVEDQHERTGSLSLDQLSLDVLRKIALHFFDDKTAVFIDRNRACATFGYER